MADTKPHLQGSRYDVDVASVGFLFWRVYNLWHRQIKESLAELEISHAQYTVLAAISYLGSTKSDVSQQDVADQLAMDKMTVSDLVKGLEKRKLLSKKPNHLDRRSYSLELTPNTKKVMKSATPAVETVDESFFGTLSPDQLRAFARSLFELADLKGKHEGS